MMDEKQKSMPNLTFLQRKIYRGGSIKSAGDPMVTRADESLFLLISGD